MIILKEEPLQDPSTAAYDPPPPSYHQPESSSSSSIRSKNLPPPPLHPRRPTPTSSLASSPSPPPSFPQPERFSHALTTLIESKIEAGGTKLKSGILEFLSGGTAQNTRDARNMAYNSVRDVVKHPEAQQSEALIETCAEICRTKGVNFSEILQDPVFEGHRALYWIIISRPSPSHYGLLSTILKYSGPLSPEAANEVRLACLQVGDQGLFSHFWTHPAYGALSGVDTMLLGGASPTDRVEVEETTIDEVGAFIARFEITHFHKRMTVSGRIVFEFIARGRLWSLKFYATPDKKTGALGPWAISLSIINPSPQTWLDSRIVITEPRGRSSSLLPPWPLPKRSAMSSLVSASSPDLRREKPPIQFRLQTDSRELKSPKSTKMKPGRNELVAHFADNKASSGLQYPDSAYYSQDGTLQVMMEARLAEPSTLTDSDCVVC